MYGACPRWRHSRGFISHLVIWERRNEVRRIVRYSDDSQFFGNFCETLTRKSRRRTMTGINRQSAAPPNATHTRGKSYRMASLLVQNGTLPVTYELVGDIVMIGRAPSNDIVIDNPVVSEQHAMLLKVGDTFWLKDLNSTNGTYIKGLLFTYGELKDGDMIRFASVMAIFAERCRKRWSTCAIRTFWTSSTTRRKSPATAKGIQENRI
jgi:pSer/pThr/pTyr-binding forkhead associated (FHA) protein